MQHEVDYKIFRENPLPLTSENKFLIFRGVRFALDINRYSNAFETYAETELRKLIRKSGQPTRTKEVGEREGDPQRSATLVVHGQDLFAFQGYAMIKYNCDDIQFFTSNQDKTISGYGKFKKNLYTMSTDEVQNRLNNYARNFEIIKKCYAEVFGKKTLVNELIMDIKNAEDIGCIYFQIDISGYYIQDRSGIETKFLEKRKLAALYLQKLFKKKLGIDLPIFAYSKHHSNLEKVEFYPKEIKSLLKGYFAKSSNSRHLFPLLNAFDFEIKSSPQLLEIAESILKKEYFFNNLSNRFKKFFGCLEYIGEENKIAEIDGDLYLAHCLAMYNKKEMSQNVALDTLQRIIQNFKNPQSNVYKPVKECTHVDANLRNFKILVKKAQSLISEEKLKTLTHEIDNTIKVIEQITQQRNLKTEKSKLKVDLDDRWFGL